MTTPEIIGQILGVVAMAFSILTFQFKDYKKLMLMQITAAAFFCAHYFLIGGINGSISNAVSIVRNVAFLLLAGKNNVKIIVACVFAAIMVGFNIVFWEGVATVLICLGMTANTASVSFNNTQRVRIAIMIACPLMLSYNIINLSVGGIINEVLVFVSSIIGLVRHRAKKQKTSIAPSVPDEQNSI